MYANLQPKYTKDSVRAYKAYYNVPNWALQSAKQNYYQTLLSSHQDSLDKLWKVLNELVSLIFDLFNLLVSEGVFPQYLKIARVIPIFKKGDKNKTINYRPISLLSQLDKLFEKMIYRRFSTLLEKYNLLSET